MMKTAELEALADMVADRIAERLAPAEWMATPAAAAHLGLSVQMLEIARHKGGGPKFHKLQRAVRYNRADLDAWMTSRERINTAGGK